MYSVAKVDRIRYFEIALEVIRQKVKFYEFFRHHITIFPKQNGSCYPG